MERVATIAGAMAMRFATTATPATITQTSQIGTTETGTAPRLLANAPHTSRPATTPSGTPITIPIRANVVAADGAHRNSPESLTEIPQLSPRCLGCLTVTLGGITSLCHAF